MAPDAASGWTRGQLLRTCRAATLLLHHLGNDPRVTSAFDTWCEHKGITIDRFRRAWAGTDADRDALIRAAWDAPEDSRAMIAAVVRDALRLDFPWLPSALLHMFRLWVENGVRRERKAVPSLWPDAVSKATLPAGRGQRQHFARDVEWFYRARVKDPREWPSEIFDDYRQQHPDEHKTSTRSNVSNAIERVQDWLDHPIAFSWDE